MSVRCKVLEGVARSALVLLVSSLGVIGQIRVDNNVVTVDNGTYDILFDLPGSWDPVLRPSHSFWGLLGTSNERWYALYAYDVHYHNLYSTSDLRLKTNIRDVAGAAEKLKALRPVTFDRKGEGTEEIGPQERKQAVAEKNKDRMGFVAQEVRKVFPNLVAENPETGMLSVNYVEMIPVLVAAIQEQQETIEDMQERLNRAQ